MVDRVAKEAAMNETTDPEDVIDPIYLPFTPTLLKSHFAPVAGRGNPGRHLGYYLNSKNARAAFPAEVSSTNAHEKRLGQQMEKDERFWVVAALMSLYHDTPDRTAAFAEVLERCHGLQLPIGGLSTWEDALRGPLELYFEVSLPSPPAYRKSLAGHLDQHMLAIPNLLAAAAAGGERLEGATKVDAVLIAPETGFAVLFEAKVLADISCHVTFDVLRNQMARNIDAMLDWNPSKLEPMKSRDPDRTCFVLLTPEMFRQHRESRLYGWLYSEYTKRDSALLSRDLPHRQADLATVPSRLGWLTWEDCNTVHPNSCRWIETSNPGATVSPLAS